MRACAARSPLRVESARHLDIDSRWIAQCSRGHFRFDLPTGQGVFPNLLEPPDGIRDPLRSVGGFRLSDTGLTLGAGLMD